MELRSRTLVANWKMNPQSKKECRELIQSYKKKVSGKTLKGELIVLPPFPFLDEVKKSVGTSHALALGSQNVSYEKMGAHTGEVSYSMLKECGVTHVLIGHSERRKEGETDAVIEKKVSLVVKSQMTAILCIGETERDPHGKYFSDVEGQLRSAFKGIQGTKLTQVIIAYEPVWAISSAGSQAHVLKADDVHEMVLFIRKIVTDLFGRAAAQKVRILYGGSVDQKSIESLVAQSGADGFLVGGASVRPIDFNAIIKHVLHAA